ncbi:retrovirus-related pol polyprotein from transposon TNT 1-94 [Tanacetum coccineum]|uniref:Retrovirus-related pol polyprotein from transposon TNT 1-94 n=1 Tax=Tanacetum coccineum TaxID=301880 RepID=A0ABQ4Z6A3_9ASTR
MFKVKMNQVLNERLLEHVINKDIMNIVVNSSVDNASVNEHECEKCLKLETELLNKKEFIEKETYDKPFRTQSQKKDTVIRKLKERIKSLSGNMNEEKVKKDIDEIETINIELDHRVSKLSAENEHLKQAYKQLLQEKDLVVTALKNELRKFKGKDLADNVVTKNIIAPEMLKIDVELIATKLLNNRTTHSYYLKDSLKTLNIEYDHRWIIETIHVDFDELTSMASEHSSSGPALNEMTPATISSGLMPNPHPSILFVPPLRTDWDILFQPLFDELLNPPSSVDCPAPKVIAPIAEVVAPEPATSTGSPFSTTVDQDAPSPSNSQTTPETQSPVIPNDVEEENHDLDVAHMNNDPFFGIPIPEYDSEASSSSNVIPTIVQTAAPNSEHVTKWTKDHPLENIIAMQEELNEFKRIKVWELVHRLDKVMVITFKWFYKVKLDELGGILKNKALLVARGYRQEEGINFEESFSFL